MAQIYSPPATAGDKPSLDEYKGDWKAFAAAEDAFREKVVELAKKNGTDPLLGFIYRIGRGDGYAEYVVWNTKPLQLIWLGLGDAWQASEAEERGTRITDVRRAAAFEALWRKASK